MTSVNNKDVLFAAIKAEQIPLDIDAIWEGNLPDEVRYTCQAPELMLEAFLRAPEMFPYADELLILWETNSNSVVGYLRNQKKYIRYYIEDGPDDYEVLGSTYQQMISDVFGKLISRGTEKSKLEDLANLFNFKYLDELRDYIARNADWEETTGDFIATVE